MRFKLHSAYLFLFLVFCVLLLNVVVALPFSHVFFGVTLYCQKCTGHFHFEKTYGNCSIKYNLITVRHKMNHFASNVTYIGDKYIYN